MAPACHDRQDQEARATAHAPHGMVGVGQWKVTAFKMLIPAESMQCTPLT